MKVTLEVPDVGGALQRLRSRAQAGLQWDSQSPAQALALVKECVRWDVRTQHLVALLASFAATFYAHWGFQQLYYHWNEVTVVFSGAQLAAKAPIFAPIVDNFPGTTHWWPGLLFTTWFLNIFFKYNATLNITWQLVLMGLTTYFVYRITRELIGNYVVAILASVLFATNFALKVVAIHVGWSYVVYAMAFGSASLWQFLCYRSTGEARYLRRSLIIWLIGMTFSEYGLGLIPFYLLVGATGPALRGRWLRQVAPAVVGATAFYFFVRYLSQAISSAVAGRDMVTLRVPWSYALLEKVANETLTHFADVLLNPGLIAYKRQLLQTVLNGWVTLNPNDLVFPRVVLLMIVGFVLLFPMRQRLRETCFLGILLVLALQVPFYIAAPPYVGEHFLAPSTIGGAVLLAAMVAALWERVQRVEYGDIGRWSLSLLVVALVGGHVYANTDAFRLHKAPFIESRARAFDASFFRLKPKSEKRPLYYAEIQGDLIHHYSYGKAPGIVFSPMLMLSVYDDFPPEVYRVFTRNFRNNEGDPRITQFDYFVRINDEYAYGMVDDLGKARRILDQNAGFIGVNNVYGFRWTSDGRFEDITADVRAKLNAPR